MHNEFAQQASLGSTGVGDLGVFSLPGIAAVANHTAFGIALFGTYVVYLPGHLRVVCADRFDTGVAFARRQATRARGGVSGRIHPRYRGGMARGCVKIETDTAAQRGQPDP